MIEGLTPAEPTLESLETIVSCVENRVKRATAKLKGAQAELEASAVALVRACEERDAWIKGNPELLL